MFFETWVTVIPGVNKKSNVNHRQASWAKMMSPGGQTNDTDVSPDQESRQS